MRTYRSVLVCILMAISAASCAQAEAIPPVAGGNSGPLDEFLVGTRWFWEGSKDHVLEFGKDGKVDLDYWKLPTDWKATGPNQVSITMHFGNEDKTAVIDFAEDRSSFSGTQFRGGVISLTPRAPDRVVGEKKPLVEFFAGTKWYWEGSKQHVLEIRKGGSLHLDYWTLPTVWKVTGPEQVSFTMHFKNGETKTAVVDFNEDRSAFSGVQFRGGVISRTPRAP